MFELRIDGEVARLALRRPKARNAIPLAGWDALAAAVADAADARLLLIEGDESAFCAGADLSEFGALHRDAAAAAAFREAMRRGIEAVASLPLPVIACIDGPCYGAGVALALACDLRLVGPGARFAITPAKIGISYPQEDVFRLVARVGAAQASKLLYTCAAIDAAEAQRIGLADGSLADLDTLVEAMLANDRHSIATLKHGIALAMAGKASDPGQDARFDALMASDVLPRRLEGRKR